jgi:paraquat-inducible protein B
VAVPVVDRNNELVSVTRRLLQVGSYLWQLYDRAKDTIVAPVRYEVEPERILGIGGKSIYKTTVDAVDAVLKKGLRASLQSSSLITGQQVVTLDFVKNAEPVLVQMKGSDFVLPSTEGGGFEGIEASAGVNKIPFKQIGENLDGILRSANEATNGPQLHEALTHLATTLASQCTDH